MKRATAVLVGLAAVLMAGCLLASVGPAAAEDDIVAQSRQDFGTWMSFYYRSKQPQTVPAAIERAGELGLFDGDALPPMLGFLTGYFFENPTGVDATLKEAKRLSARDRQAVLVAAALGAQPGSPQQNALLGRLDDNGTWLMQAVVASGIRSKDDVQTISASALDFLWGVFFATGDTKAVLPIMATSGRPKAPTDAMTLAIHGAARWALGSNARQHPAIMELCKDQIDRQPPEIASELRKIVAGE